MSKKNIYDKIAKWWNQRKDKIAILALILSITNFGVGIYLTNESIKLNKESNEVAQRSLELQNMLSNYSSTIIIDSKHVQLFESIDLDYYIDSKPTKHHGYLNVSLKIVTPHLANVSLKIKEIKIDNSYQYFLQDKENLTDVYFLYPNENVEDIVNAGLNQLNYNLLLGASVYLNSTQFPKRGLTQTYPLGELTIEAELFDLQTNISLKKEFTSTVYVSLEVI